MPGVDELGVIHQKVTTKRSGTGFYMRDDPG